MFVVQDNDVQVKDDLSLGEIAEFCWHFSVRLQNIKPTGTLALCDLPNELTRLLVLGAWHAGWAVAMLPAHFSKQQKAAALASCQVRMLIGADETLADLGIEHFLALQPESAPYCFDTWLGQPTENLAVAGYNWSPTATALILFSSGSTGEPKGICHSVQNMLISAQRFIQHFNIRQNDVLLNCAELHTMSGFRGSVMLPLLRACQLYDEAFARDLPSVMAALESCRATIAILGPNLVRQLAQLAAKVTHLNQHLRAIFSTGARLSPSDKQQLYNLAGLQVFDYYGLTETGGIVIGQTILTDAANPSLGQACTGVTLKIVAADGSEHDTGIGELRIYATGLFLAYTGHPEILRDYVDSGDRVEINASGLIYWLHRAQHGYKAASTEWIYPELVENWLKLQTEILDAQVSPFYDERERLRLLVRVTGIHPTDFASWCNSSTAKLVAALGRDYNILEWKLENNLTRSSLGKAMPPNSHDTSNKQPSIATTGQAQSEAKSAIK